MRPDPSIGIEELRTLVGLLPDVVVLVGLDRRIRYINRSAEGYGVPHLVGRDYLDFVEPSFREAQAEMFRQVLDSGEPTSGETMVMHSGGVPEWHEGTMIPLVRAGKVADVAIVTKNVTARRLAEEEARTLRELVPVCSWCRRIRDDEGQWQELECYIAAQGLAGVTHGMCTACQTDIDLDCAERAG
jgi:PAS domain S-box-containing protein